MMNMRPSICRDVNVQEEDPREDQNYFPRGTLWLSRSSGKLFILARVDANNHVLTAIWAQIPLIYNQPERLSEETPKGDAIV